MDNGNTKFSDASLSDIYEKIPCSVCDANCFRCCTNMVQFTDDELSLMGGYEFDGKCSHLKNGKCSIYEHRPFVCRIYGTSELLRCEGCTPSEYLSEEQTLELIHKYNLLLQKRKANEEQSSEKKS